MPAKSKNQQALMGMALAVRRGEMSRDEVDDEVLKIVDGDMSTKDIEDFARTLRKGLPRSLKEWIEDGLEK